MAKKLHLAFGLILVLFFLRQVGTSSSHGEVPWFVGCYNNSDLGEDSPFEPLYQLDQVTPFSCIRLCASNESFRYAAVNNGSRCFCLSQIQDNSSINQTFCNISCHGDTNVTCGGTNSSSVYSTAVPLLVSLNISLPKQVITNTSVTAVSELSIKRPRYEVSGLDRIRQGNQTADSISIEWYSEFKLYNTTWHTLQGNWTRTLTQLVFNLPGNHNMCVRAHNLFSSQERCTLVSIVAPITGLRLVTVFQERTRLDISLSLPIFKTLYLKYLIESGSTPEFYFTFGDGSSPLIVTNSVSGRNSLECTCVTVSHVFNQCGNFTVNVTALNDVSHDSVTLPVEIDLFVDSLELAKNGRNCMYVEANVSATLTAKIKEVQGCRMFYEWNFNDLSPRVTTDVPTVSHVFSGSQLRYFVKVVAYNKLGRKQAMGQVCVQDRLKDLILKPEVSHLIVSTTKTVTIFTPHLSPMLARYGRVLYSLQRSDKKDPIPGHTSFPVRFRNAGRYVVFAEAKNEISGVKSNKILVCALEPIGGLSIHHDGTTLRGKKTHLVARLDIGTNVSFYWDFGDGLQNSTLNTTTHDVFYTFKKTGNFKISVTANNALNREEEASITIAVTFVPHCYPPEVTIFGAYGTEVNRSKEIRLEADVTLNCSEAKELLYLWKVTYNSGPKKNQLADLDDISFAEQVLIIPPRTLDYGKYYIQLQVKVKGTVLTAENRMWIKVVKSPLVAIIAGGTTKVVGRKKKDPIVMDASSSHDPDYPDEKDKIGFQWSCHPLGQKNTSCFNETNLRKIEMKSVDSLTFHLDSLLADVAFEFLVTVYKDSRNFTTFQILYVHDTQQPLLLSANCLQCEKGPINPSLPLVITGLCLSCPLDNSNITYKWQLYHVGKSELLKEEECQTISSASHQTGGNLNDGVRSTQKLSPTLPPLTYRMPVTKKIETTTVQLPTSHKVTLHTTQPAAEQILRARFSSGLICQDPNHIVGPTLVPPTRHSTRRPRGPGSGWGSGGGWGGKGTGSGTGKGTGFGTGSGKGTGSGSASGWKPNFGSGARRTNIPVPTTQSHLNLTTKAPVTDDRDDDDDDDHIGNIYDPRYTPPSARHSSSIVRLTRRQMRLPEKQTTTGLRRQNFVLLGKFLQGGHPYMLSFKVFDGNTGREGKATVYFNTSDIPECGICSVTPGLGVALETSFELKCSKWIVLDNWPHSYHVSYIIDGDSNAETFFVYTGFRSVVPFVLPAGTVQIHVSVEDGGGSKRRIQPIQVKVKSRVLPEGVSTEEFLLNKTVGKNLSLLQEAGNEQGVRQFITALANSLNRLGPVKNISSKFYLRIQIREKLLWGIRNLTVYDKNSAFQTGLALKTLTKKPEELSASSVETASQILHKLGEVMKSRHRMMYANWIEARDLLSQEFIQIVTKVTSNLIQAASLPTHRNTGTSFVRQESKGNVLLKATEAVEELIKVKLSTQVLGEQSLHVTTRNIRVVAKQMSSVSNTLFSLGDVKFHMPTNLEKQLNIESAGKEGSCYGTVMTVYNENPFFSEMLHTRVGSLSINHCNGEEIQVKNLSNAIHISIPHENHQAGRHTEKFTLKWRHQNTHVINQTDKMLNQSLHISLKLLSVLPPGFVLKLIASTVQADSSSNKHNQYTVTSSGGAVDLYLSQRQLINASGSVFARVLLEDTAYYRIKSAKNGSLFDYLLSVQWMGCFYWNKQNSDWFSDGCELTSESTDQMLFCRCNHLTAFSGAFVNAPNSLRIQDLRDSEKLKQSPITMILVICIMAVYLLLIGFCVRADMHDKKKLGAVNIDDNTTPAAMSQRFQITVQTGHWFGAGTTADVYLVLHGEDHVSNPIELKCAGKPLFQRSSCDVFVVSVPKSFSNNVDKIHVWHDNTGEHPSWFLEQIVIKDVSTGVKWIFDCNRWLAVDEEDGKVECGLLPNTTYYNSSLRKCFSHHSAKSFVDYHLWLSLLGRPSYSRFTRAQRLSCGLSLLLSFLCVNIAWYRPKAEVPEVLGIIDISVESILVGVLCSIIVLPVNLLWIFLFRYSRRSFRHRVKVFPINEQPSETTELVSSSVLDQSLETVLILKNIGERRRWFQTSLEIDDVHSGGESLLVHPGDSLIHHPCEIVECASDGTSLGYSTGHDTSSSHPPLPTASAGLVETCDFLAALAPSSKKHPVEFDKRSNYSVCMSSSASEGRGPYRSRFSLPHLFLYVGWFGCLLTAAIAGLFTIWYGISFGWDLSMRWLQSLCISLLESFLVSQPIMVLVFILYMACKSQARKEDEDVDDGFGDVSSSALHEIHYGQMNEGFEDETTRAEDDLDPALAIRKRQRYLKFLKPPSKSKLFEARENCVRSKALWNYTVELLVFIMFLVVTWLLIASVTSSDMYRLNQSIKKIFLRPENPSWSGHGSVKDTWNEISAVLNDNSTASSYTPFTILLRDSQSLLFGRTRITQFKNPLLTVCQEVPLNTNQSSNVTNYASSNETTSVEHPHPLNTNQSSNVTNYASSNETTSVCHAKCHAKGGTWMMLELNQTRAESAQQLTDITDSQWINECTREINMEFTIYTPLLRAVSAATLSVKASYVRKPESHLELNTFPAFFESTDYGYFVRICKLVFVAVFLYLLQHEIFMALKMSTTYFTNFWRLFQLVIVAVSSLCVMMFIHWSVCLYALLREVETTAQTQVFYYAKLVFRSQETLQTSYSLLIFLLVVRCVYVLRPFRFVRRLGRIFASVAYPLLACTVVIVIFMMSFAHPGHLLFGRLHVAFKSFGETFLLVSSFFRLEGVARYQDPALEEHSLLISFYFALFLIGFCVVMRGTTAAVFVYGMPHFKKRRSNLLSDVVEDFILNKLQLLKEKTRRPQRRYSTSDEEEEDEDDDFLFELEELEDNSTLPREHVLDVVEDQIEEMESRVQNLFGSDLFADGFSYSLEDSEDDVEYLYRADRPSVSSGSGYESDHSTMSAVKWQLSSSSSHDISDESSRHAQHVSSRSATFTVGEAELYKLRSHRPRLNAYHDEDKSNLSCSSCYEIEDRSADSPWYVDSCERHQSGVHGKTNILRDIVLRDSDLRDGVLRDYNSRDDYLHDGKINVYRTVSSDNATSQELSSSSGNSLRMCVVRDETFRPKAMHGMKRSHSRRGPEAFPDVSALSPRPSTAAEGGDTQAATTSSSDQDAGRRTKNAHPRKAKGLFRSSAVHPCQEGLTLGHSSPLPHRAARRTNSGSGDSGVQCAWGPAPSVSSPDPEVSELPLKGLLRDISMNRRLGTEIRNDDNHVPGSTTPVSD